MHIQRRYVEQHPERAYFHHLRKSARKRDIEFTITFEQFCEFLNGKKFFGKTGLAADSLTIDRIEGNRGYIHGNLQIKTRSSNSQKYWATDRHYRFSDVVHNDVGEVEFDVPPF